jgi:hypothetical protein
MGWLVLASRFALPSASFASTDANHAKAPPLLNRLSICLDLFRKVELKSPSLATQWSPPPPRFPAARGAAASHHRPRTATASDGPRFACTAQLRAELSEGQKERAMSKGVIASYAAKELSLDPKQLPTTTLTSRHRANFPPPRQPPRLSCWCRNASCVARSKVILTAAACLSAVLYPLALLTFAEPKS